MLRSIRILNFQSHKDSFLEFSPGINVIAGPSNNGKTAVLRSFNWVIFNRPTGFGFKSNFSEKKQLTEVCIKSDNYTVERIKGTTTNRYKLGDQIFEALGSAVPDQIKDAINLNETNVQNQLDKHFLLTDSPGEIGRTINQLTRLEDIDIVISRINSKISDNNKETEFHRKELIQFDEELEQYHSLPDIEEIINNLCELEEKEKEIDLNQTGIKVIVAQIEKFTIVKDQLTKVLELESIATPLQIDVDHLNEVNDDINCLDGFVKGLNEVHDTIHSNEEIIACEQFSQGLEGDLDRYNDTIINCRMLFVLIEDIQLNTEKIQKNIGQLAKDEKEFNKSIKKWGCPLCERAYG